MKLLKFVKRYDTPKGVVRGSVTWSAGLLAIDEPPEIPLVEYAINGDTYPDHGLLMCFKAVSEEARKKMDAGVELWEVGADRVAILVPKVIYPPHLKLFPSSVITFWRNSGRGIPSWLETKTIDTPPLTVFCSRVRLLEQVA